MDLTLVYMARFRAKCADPVWKQVPGLRYQDVGFTYDGGSSCTKPASGPPSPANPYASEHHGHRDKSTDTSNWGQQALGSGGEDYANGDPNVNVDTVSGVTGVQQEP